MLRRDGPQRHPGFYCQLGDITVRRPAIRPSISVSLAA